MTIATGILSVSIAVRALGPSSFGLVATLTGVVGLLGFLDFGVSNSLISKVSGAYARADMREVKRETFNTAGFLLTLALILSVAAITLAATLPNEVIPGAEEVGEEPARISLLIFLVGVALSGLAALGSKVALGLQRGRENNVVAVAGSVLLLSLSFIGWATHMPVEYFVFISIFSGLIVNSVQTVLRLSTLRQWAVDRLKLKEHVRSFVSLAAQGVPFTVLVVSGAVAYQTDLLVISFVAGLTAAAAYGLLARIFSALTTLLGGGIAQMWASTAHALATGDHEWVSRTFKRMFLITGGLYAGASVILCAIAAPLLKLWSGGTIIPSTTLILAFAAWNTYAFLMSQFSTLLNGAGRVKAQAIASGVMALVNLPLSVHLTTQWGPSGPLWASLITHISIVGVPTILMVKSVLTPKRLEVAE